MPDRLCDIADVCERRRRVRAVRGYANSEVARRITVNCMAGYNQREFVQALKRNPEERLPQVRCAPPFVMEDLGRSLSRESEGVIQHGKVTHVIYTAGVSPILRLT